MSDATDGFFTSAWRTDASASAEASPAAASAVSSPAPGAASSSVDPLDALPGRFVAADVRAKIGQLPPAQIDTGDAVWAQINLLIDTGLRYCEVLAVLLAADRFADHRAEAEAFLAGQRDELEEMRRGYRSAWQEFSASAQRARAILDKANRDIATGREQALRAQQALADEQRKAFDTEMDARRKAADQRNKQWMDAFLGTRRY